MEFLTVITIFSIGAFIYFLASGAKSEAGEFLSKYDVDKEEITVKYRASSNGRAVVKNPFYDKKMMMYSAEIVRRSDGKSMGIVVGNSLEEFERRLNEYLEVFGERASVEDLTSADGLFKVRDVQYDAKFMQYRACIIRVSAQYYVRSAWGETMKEVGDEAKKELENLSVEYNKHR